LIQLLVAWGLSFGISGMCGTAGRCSYAGERWSGDELVSMLQEFETELRDAGLADNSVNTYVQRSMTFVRWLRGEYTPRGPNSARP
jgi:hypothetical protein